MELSDAIIDAVERVRRTPDLSLGAAASTFLYERGMLTEIECGFLARTHHKEILSVNEIRTRIEIHMGLLDRLGLTPVALETIMNTQTQKFKAEV